MRVTVVIGAVGSGKTSLISHFLSGLNDGKRIAYLECRFAVDIGCDSLVRHCRHKSHFEAFETLEHLCLCCSPRDEFHEVIESLAGLGASQRFDRIIVEATGLADPAFMRPLLEEEAFVVDSVVCVVRAEVLPMLPLTAANNKLRSIELEQIAFASCVVVWGDQISVASALETISRVALPYLSNRVIVTCDGNMTYPSRLAQHMFPSSMEKDITLWTSQPIVALDSSYFKALVPHRRHQDKVHSLSLVGVGPLPLDAYHRVLRWASQVSCIRLKGTLYIEEEVGGGQYKMLLDGAWGQIEEEKGQSWNTGEEIPANKIALIIEGEPATQELQHQLERATGIAMHPTVLYSAPPPNVDTWTQRLILVAVLVIVWFLSPEALSEYRMWFFWAWLLYFFMSIQRQRTLGGGGSGSSGSDI